MQRKDGKKATRKKETKEIKKEGKTEHKLHTHTTPQKNVFFIMFAVAIFLPSTRPTIL